MQHFDATTGIDIGELQIQPFTVPHDAREPCQFTLQAGSRRLGMLTDSRAHDAAYRRIADRL